MKRIFSLLILAAFSGICSAQSISSISPSAADAGQTLQVSISGGGFISCVTTASMTLCSNALSGCSLNSGGASIAVTGFSVNTASSASGTIGIPATAPTGSWNLSATTSGGTLQDNNAFTVNPACDSLIDSISPRSANAGQRVTMTIYALHAHFLYVQSSTAAKNVSAVQLSLGGSSIPADSFSVSSCFVCKAYFTLPASTQEGEWCVTVSQTLGRPSVALAGCFFIRPIPHILSMTPDSGVQGEQVAVQINGHSTDYTLGVAESSNVNKVALFMNSQTIAAQTYSPASDTVLNAVFALPVTAAADAWSLIVGQGNDYLADTFPNCFTITPASQVKMTISTMIPDTFVVDSSYRILLSATGGKGSLTWSLLKGPAGMSLTLDTLKWEPATVIVAADTLELRLADLAGDVDTLTQVLWTNGKTGVLGTRGKSCARMSVRSMSIGNGGFMADITTGAAIGEPIRVRLYNLKGSLIRSWSSAGQKTMQLRVDGSGLAKGLLMLQVNVNGRQMRAPVMVE